VCSPGANPACPPCGDAFILTTTEQATVTAAVDGYNAFISAEATSLGFAYYDPNPTLVTLRTAGTVIRNTPSYCQSLPACATPTAPFGTGMSLDGVHPGASVHLLLANEIIAAINTKYGTTLPNVF
jgi:phospholipase/lecithinase/hemolysin